MLFLFSPRPSSGSCKRTQSSIWQKVHERPMALCRWLTLWSVPFVDHVFSLTLKFLSCWFLFSLAVSITHNSSNCLFVSFEKNEVNILIFQDLFMKHFCSALTPPSLFSSPLRSAHIRVISNSGSLSFPPFFSLFFFFSACCCWF
jgi:hypothetical protein